MMNELETFYDVLEIVPDASPQEIRSAYLRAKSAYKKDSVALYSLMSDTETDALLSKIEQAYQVLSNPEKRRDYDRLHHEIEFETKVWQQPEESEQKSPSNVISIDRFPPMENLGPDENPLIAPNTDFQNNETQSATPSKTGAADSHFAFTDGPALNYSTQVNPATGLENFQHSSSASHQFDVELNEQIASETEWKGLFLREVREKRKVSIEEISEYTKITKTYILAVEEENYAKLPAPVYLRGFITQIAKFLKLPHEKVATAYMSRYNTHKK